MAPTFKKHESQNLKKNCQFDDGSPDPLAGQAAVGNQEVLVEKDKEAPLVLPT